MRVDVNILRFDATPGKEVLLTARWSIADPEREEELTAQEASFRERPDGPGYPELVAAMSRSLTRLSKKIAQNIQILTTEKNH